jgi:signal transduction histidine kinase
MSAVELFSTLGLSDPVVEEAMGLVWGALGFLTISYALSRALKASQHGLSIRLQLFFTLFFASMVITSLIGVWALQRIEAEAVLLFNQRGLSAEVLEEFMRDFGAKTSLIFGLLALICAGGAWALGRGIASPIEQLAEAAKGVSDGDEISSLPRPAGREVRRLHNAILVMHEALEDRRQFERFIADLSHDLKNPVASIRASIEVLQSGAGEEPEARAQFLDRVEEASGRLNRILSDFLGIARLEARGVRFDPHPLPMSAPIQASIRMMRDIADARSITLRTAQITQRGEPYIQGSSRWLSRAIDNLLTNAIRHSPLEGSVWIDYWGEGDRCFILVSDEGDGIPELLKPHIFNRFISQAHLESAESTGLGLAIVKRIVEAHGGRVGLLSSSSQKEGISSLDSSVDKEHLISLEGVSSVEPRAAQGAQLLIMLPLAVKGDS